MSAVPKPLLTPEEYLARERRAEYKSEFYRGGMYAMHRADRVHDLIRDNFALAAGNRLLGSPLRVVTGDTRFKVQAAGLYSYADILIPEVDPHYEDEYRDTLLNPLAIVEVLSDSTEAYDRGTKFHRCDSIASLREFVVVLADEPQVERYVRQSDGSWLLSLAEGVEGTLEFAAVPLRVPLAEIYRSVTFPETPDYAKLAAAGIFRAGEPKARHTYQAVNTWFDGLRTPGLWAR